MVFTFEDIVNLAKSINNQYTDRRPEWLRKLRDAEHPAVPYYKFLFEIGDLYKPLNILEIGTFVGTSAAHLVSSSVGTSAAHLVSSSDPPTNSITTIDINPDAFNKVQEFCPDNVKSIICSSATAMNLEEIKCQKFDVLFVDGLHDFNTTYGEYYHYRQLVKDKGLMIFDDVNLEMNGDEMNVFWSFVLERKERVDWLHIENGFGIVEKDDNLLVPSFNDIIGEASYRIERNKAK